jgi:hypothetical protein
MKTRQELYSLGPSAESAWLSFSPDGAGDDSRRSGQSVGCYPGGQIVELN